ncbi:hypothetical protein WOLCODRAFT_28871 [Wolfiporia cocos MD-104 SS10]|uniref:Thioester reductase (TE) domain-containing protein n=1 Tax=Wolfiporia cocos (strain MD-104) TaxID=742152 RepID=A0A2H3JGX0_WOLCO|nr:hypothetical protein WOLCODRAFT_28871 [Wolfiporia cocos MD-104 SS10]
MLAQNVAESILTMRRMADGYTAQFPSRPTILIPAPTGDVVLVTGTTGSLGCHLLKSLASDTSVLRVYALNRPAKNKATLRDRQKEALIDRVIDASILDLDKVVLLEGELTEPNWGLSANVYEEIHQSVTHIIHNAWRVDLVAPLPAFEPVIRGVRRLVDFALTSPLVSTPRIVYISSMAVIREAPQDMIIPETPVDPAYAAGGGYPESKWIAEQIMYTAAQKTPLDPIIVRVGQVSGGPGGDWSPHEWVPIMVQSAPKLRCFPEDSRNVEWIPFDIAASAILDFRHASNDTHTVHLVHPRPAPWRTIALAIATEFAVPLVPFSEWLARLEDTAKSARNAEQEGASQAARGNARRIRALRLIPFFRSQAIKAKSGRMALGWQEVEVERAVKASPTLADPALRQLNAVDVKRWIAYWRKVGLLTDNSVSARL